MLQFWHQTCDIAYRNQVNIIYTFFASYGLDKNDPCINCTYEWNSQVMHTRAELVLMWTAGRHWNACKLVFTGTRTCTRQGRSDRGGISVYIPPPNQFTLNFFMWLFCLFDPSVLNDFEIAITIVDIYTHYPPKSNSWLRYWHSCECELVELYSNQQLFM